MDDVRGLWLTRLLLLRGTGMICLIAFIVVLNQFRPLLGDAGLLPVRLFCQRVPFAESPSLFYLFPNNTAFAVAAWVGVALSVLAIGGVVESLPWPCTMALWGSMYLLYLSFVNVGQVFYGFGWESILLEACFFCMFLGGGRGVPSWIAIYLFRWLLFRVMFGAGLIKLRGDRCWRDLTCLSYFYETQPMPNPLSWYWHWAPPWFNKGGVVFNHISELVVPFFYFLPQPFAGIAGILTIVFQLTIILGGNLSWLNWLTIVLALSTLDARFFSLVAGPSLKPVAPVLHWMCIGMASLVALMSIPVVLNMISPGQIMNTSYNSLHLVGSYGAFGSITRPRFEVVVEGTSDAVVTPATVWKVYEFKAKPTGLGRMPPWIAPYHLRLDWLMWFAALSDYRQHPWFLHFLAKLLAGDSDTLSLLATNPFPERPPVFIRADLYEYHFTTPPQRKVSGAWWTAQRVGTYFPAVGLNDPYVQSTFRAEGWDR